MKLIFVIKLIHLVFLPHKERNPMLGFMPFLQETWVLLWITRFYKYVYQIALVVKFLKNILAIAALEFQMMAVTDLVVLKIREDFQDIRI
jgi:hypothetical protein